MENPYEYVVMNPLKPNDKIPTERRDVIPGRNGWSKIKSPSLAQEIKQRYPWMIVREFENGQGGRSTRFTMTVPQMPWKIDKERQEQFIEFFNEYYQFLNQEQYEENETNNVADSGKE